MMLKDKLIYFIILLFCITTHQTLRANVVVENNTHIISKRLHCLKPGETFELKALWYEPTNPEHKVYWVSTDATIAETISPTNDRVTIKANRLGQCDVKLYSNRKEVGKCRVIVDNDGVIKILAIGNSFSEDALEEHLYPLIAEEGVKVIVANMYIPGCSLERHWNNAKSNRADYSYRKIVDGKKNITDKFSILKALNDENWDFISFQQASHLSGIYTTYAEFLPQLLSYVKANNKNRETVYVIHQTWAYEASSNHNGFMNYNNSQSIMYYDIINANNQAADLVGLDIIIPVGTAVQNGRTSSVADNFNRDGYHLDYNIGRYTASCTWAYKLLGHNLIGSNYVPRHMTLKEIFIGQSSAINAVISPNNITIIPF